MKQMFSFLTVFLLTFLTWGNLSAADLPTISPADGSADVWYHIRVEVRGHVGLNPASASGKGYYCDKGRGELLENVADTIDGADNNIPGTRWKVVATSSSTEYQLISGLGNTIAFGAGEKSDQFYTTTLGSQVFTIKNPNGDFLGLTLVGTGGIDKSNSGLYFGKYGPDATGGAITFQSTEPLTGTYLFQPGDLDLGDVPVGSTKTKTLTVAGANLSGNLTYTLTGEGFSKANEVSATGGGSVEITFAPTEKKAYTATITVTYGELPPVTATLTGNADFEFPLEISEGDTEYWYYIRFEQQTESNKVFQANSKGTPLTQNLILGNENKQLWKIVGDWGEYHLVNKDGNFDLVYNTANNRYEATDAEYGDEFGFERFKDTEDWQLGNMTSGYFENGIASETRRYVNDLDAEGDSITNYVVNDDGNRLIFIPSTASALVIGLESIDFGNVPAGVAGANVKKTLPVGGLGVTGSISAVIEGPGSAAFALTSATLPAAGGEFEITFTPQAVDNYKAQLIVSAEGFVNDTVQLTAIGSAFPFQVSTTTDYWYYIQFSRRSTLALTSAGLGETVTQTPWQSDQEANEDQMWKITGTWDNYKFVSKKGGELKTKPSTEPDADPDDFDDYTLEASGDGHIALGTNDGEWYFQNIQAKEAGYVKYINDRDGATVCLYGNFDNGAPLNFIPVSGIVTNPVSPLAYGDVTIGMLGEKTLTVTGKGTTAPITYVLAGAGASVFSISNTTAAVAADADLPAAGGTLKVSFLPEEAGDYIATLTLSTTGAPDAIIVLTGRCISLPEDFPVKISDDESTSWYTVYFTRRYTSANSWKVWTAGLTGETIKQTTHTGREDEGLTTEEQLWKFVAAPSKTGYLAVAYSGLAAKKGSLYTVADEEEATPLVFVKNSDGNWVLKSNDTTNALNDNAGTQIGEYSINDGGNPLGFIETEAPAPVRIQLYTQALDFGKIEAGVPAPYNTFYSSNVIVKGVGLTGDISVSVSDNGVTSYSIIHAADSSAIASTIPQAGDTLKIIFNPQDRHSYNATVTFTAEGAAPRTLSLTGGGNLNLPVKLSTAAEPIWYYISFERQATKVLTVEGDTIFQRAKATEATDAQLWRIEGSVATGYQIINKTGVQAAYDSTSTVRAYLPVAEGDHFLFESGIGANTAKVQMRNITNEGQGSFLCDKGNQGVYATNYSKNDGGNFLIFTPLDESGVVDGIILVDADENDPVISSAYYNLQGIRILQPVRGSIYIRIDTHASKKTTATKFLLVK
jgi:hypothetical protein